MPRGRAPAKKQTTYLDFIIRPRGFECDFNLNGSEPEDVRKIASFFEKDKYRALYNLSFEDHREWYSPSLKYLVFVGETFVREIRRTEDIELKRADTSMPSADPGPVASSVPFIPGSEFVTPQWVTAVWTRFLALFREDISHFDGKVELYFSQKNSKLNTPGRIFFHLVENRHSDELPFAFMATYTDGTTGKHLPLRYALQEYKGDQQKMLELLSYLSKVADRSSFISGFIESGELFHPLWLSSEEAFRFLKEIPLYEECGILCRIPNWWRHRGNTAVSIQIDGNSLLGTDSILSCQPSLTVDGVPITEAEARQLLAQTEGLAMLKGKWVEVNHDKLKELLSKIDAINGEYGDGISVIEALRFTAGLGKDDEKDVAVSNPDWVKVFSEADLGRDPKGFETPPTFRGTLRDYQKTGAEWLSSMRRMGFGCCLADDMGLGKTVQVLAFLESRRPTDRRNLLVVPASLIGNWEKEASRFTPEMTYGVVQGGAGTIGDEVLTIATYGTVVRNKGLQQVHWDNVILDEAQAIKNSGTKQSKSVRELKANGRFALTGTPVENRLSDLWSLFDFMDPGLLGDVHEFKGFADHMVSEGMGYARLRNMISPFMLRRLKTDRSIAGDLPDKMEIDEYVDLSKKQTVLYNKLLSEMAAILTDTDKKSRVGLVLAMLTKFKQICNHPDQYLGLDTYDATESGKFQMLGQICETILDKREKVLVFTQYREMTEPLRRYLTGVFGRDGLVFHGGMTPKERTAAVDRFNSEDEYIPFMVISIKAGGVGLNLTSANHVVHFDRWWNPAVENQATDRAFRIGQTKNVIVHKFICRGTLEEKIDALIKSKKELAENVIGAGENWIADLDNEQLIDLFRLEA